MGKCRYCKYFIGAGDWNLCCQIKPDLCYPDCPACEDFVPHNGKTSSKLNLCGCGGTPYIIRDWGGMWDDAHVFCPECGSKTMTYTRRYNAVKAWNEGRIYYSDGQAKKK